MHGLRPEGAGGAGSARLSIIVPTLNEATSIGETLAALAPLRAIGVEVVVADGGSSDGTADLAVPLADRVLTCAPAPRAREDGESEPCRSREGSNPQAATRPPYSSAPQTEARSERGRARQQNAGAADARGGILLFLHADTRLPEGAIEAITMGLARSGRGWGRFDVRLSGDHPAFRVIERMISLRSRLSGIATGDQAIFVMRDLFERVGGFPDLPLMEDVALSKLLRATGRPLCLRDTVTTSSRRWESRGIVRTVLLMWRLRFAYWMGESPAVLAARYR